MNTDNISNILKYKCPFCIQEFENPDNTMCKSCRLNIDCTMIKCPNCGYEFPDLNKGITGKLSLLISKLLKK